MNLLFTNNLILGLTAWGIAFIIAVWVSLIIWTYRDIRSRARDPLMRILAIIVVTLLFLPGMVVYLILRPVNTLEEDYQHTLEEEALLQSIEDSPLCPGCGRRIRDAWIICPNCHTKLKKPCHQCGRLMELPWNLCPFCGTPAPGMRLENLATDDALPPIPVEETPNPERDNLSEEMTEAEGQLRLNTD